MSLPTYGHRRTKGLRREELAQLSGISVDYLMRLEQGRFMTPSAQVVGSLARSLQLDRGEADVFYQAAGLARPSTDTVSRHIPPGVQRMVARMEDMPLAVFAADWTLLTSTRLWWTLLGSTPAGVGAEQNLIVQTFVDNSVADVATPHGGAEPFERALVADLRRSAASLTADQQFQDFITDVRSTSPRFASMWDEGRATAHASIVKTIHHPVVGDVTLDCDVLTVPDSDVKLIVYSTASGSPDAEKLDFLRVSAVTADRGQR